MSSTVLGWMQTSLWIIKPIVQWQILKTYHVIKILNSSRKTHVYITENVLQNRKCLQQFLAECSEVSNEFELGCYYRCNNYVARKVSFCVIAWTWRHRHSSLNCLITWGSTQDWGDCLLFMLLLCTIIKLQTWCCWSTIIENSKQKTTKHR